MWGKQEFNFSKFHWWFLPSQLAGHLLVKSQVEAQPGEVLGCQSHLPTDTLDTYSEYTHFQNMRPPGLEAMVSRSG